MSVKVPANDKEYFEYEKEQRRHELAMAEINRSRKHYSTNSSDT
jgi:hypothetical protein